MKNEMIYTITLLAQRTPESLRVPVATFPIVLNTHLVSVASLSKGTIIIADGPIALEDASEIEIAIVSAIAAYSKRT